MKRKKKTAKSARRKKPQSSILQALITHAAAAFCVLALCSTLYFYVVLPRITNHEKYVTVPDLTGLGIAELKPFLLRYRLRYEVSDSSYSARASALTVLQQFPRAGEQVKINRRIYITINQTNAPTTPLPNVIDQSRINASAVLHNNNLQVGEIIWEPSPFFNLIKETRLMGNSIEPGTLVPRGTAIDLVVGDGRGNFTFAIESLIGASYEQAIAKLEEWNLRVGNVETPVGIDTTNTFPVVYKQHPEEGELIHIGDVVDIWLAPAGYEPPFFDEGRK